MTAAATLSTFVVLRDLASGEVLGFPAADPLKASIGEEAAVLTELELFLRETFARERPEVIARHALPDTVRLHVTQVVLPRDELPRRLAIETPVDVPYLTVPHALGTWVMVLPFAHTFHTDPTEDIAEAVRLEAARLVVGQSLDAYEYLTKLPAYGHRLLPMTVPLEGVRDERPTGDVRKAVARHERQKTAAEVLRTVATPLHGREEPRVPRPIPGATTRSGC